VIIEALKVMLFGMCGIFFVMSLIIAVISLMSFFQKGKTQNNTDTLDKLDESE